MRTPLVTSLLLPCLLQSGGPPEPLDTSAGIQTVCLYEAETGGYAHYRVPAIVVSPAGTVAVAIQ